MRCFRKNCAPCLESLNEKHYFRDQSDISLIKQELISHLAASPGGRMVATLSAIAEAQFAGLRDERSWKLRPEQGFPSSPGQPFTLRDVLDLSMSADKEIAFRAAWLLEQLTVVYQGLSAVFDIFLECLPALTNYSVMRHHGKIFACATGKNAPEAIRIMLRSKDLNAEAELFFGWLIEQDTPVAVKVHAMQSLANLAPYYSWIKEELLETVAYLESKESIAFFARAKQIRKQLKKV